MDAYDRRETIPPITSEHPDFDTDAAYEVLAVIEQRRRASGWRSVGRKIGFTNRTLWPRYNIWQPMWASMWEHGIHPADDGHASFSLLPLVQPRIEPEVVFCLREALAPTDDATEILRRTEWIAASFEIVHAHFPDWKFAAPDCTAAFGLHGGLVIGTPLTVTDENRDLLVDALPRTEVTLSKGGTVVDRGVGSDVLDSPALALAHLHASAARAGRGAGAGRRHRHDRNNHRRLAGRARRHMVFGLWLPWRRGPRRDVHRQPLSRRVTVTSCGAAETSPPSPSHPADRAGRARGCRRSRWAPRLR